MNLAEGENDEMGISNSRERSQLKNTSCNVCNEIFIVKRKYSGYSHRHLELLMRAAANLGNALFKKYSRSNILSFHFLEMFSSNVCKKSVNAITLGDAETSNVLGLVEAESSSNACYAMKLARVISTG